jgi:transcriptional regulator with XRE-family HTH domain
MNKTLGGKIRELRVQKDLGLRELARKIGISAAFLSDIEQGRRYPSDNVLKDIAHTLGVPISHLEIFDSRAPIEELKRIVEINPNYGFALRSLAQDPDKLLQFLRKTRKKDEDNKN